MSLDDSEGNSSGGDRQRLPDGVTSFLTSHSNVTAELLEDRVIPLSAPNTFEEWQSFVNTPAPAKPSVHKPEIWEQMSEAEKQVSRDIRRRYHAAMSPIAVQAMKKVNEALLLTAMNNLYSSPSAKPGGVIDGYSQLGKTTMLMQLGRLFELGLRSKYPHERLPNGSMFIPVVFITLPDAATIKSLDYELAEYYGIPLPKKSSGVDVSILVKKYANKCGTSLCLIDDVHYLQWRKGKPGAADRVINHLKYYQNGIPATFVFASVGAEDSGLLSEGKLETHEIYAQTRNRLKLFKIKPYSIRDEDKFNEWVDVLNAFEAELCLVNHEPDSGKLRTLALYLFKRTRGYLGALSVLIREGVRRAIKDGDEELTEAVFDRITLDYGSEKTRGDHVELNG